MKRLLSTFKISSKQKETYDCAPLTQSVVQLSEARNALHNFKKDPLKSSYNSDEEIRTRILDSLKNVKSNAENAPSYVDTKPAHAAATYAMIDYHKHFSSDILPANILTDLTERVETSFNQSNLSDPQILADLYETVLDKHAKTISNANSLIDAHMNADQNPATYIRDTKEKDLFQKQVNEHIDAIDALTEKLSHIGCLTEETCETAQQARHEATLFESKSDHYLDSAKKEREKLSLQAFNQRGGYKGSFADLTMSEALIKAANNTNQPAPSPKTQAQQQPSQEFTLH